MMKITTNETWENGVANYSAVHLHLKEKIKEEFWGSQDMQFYYNVYNIFRVMKL